MAATQVLMMAEQARGRIEVRRIYEVLGGHRSYRVLVDRLWPRGVKKEDAALDEWAKDVAPSDGLRRWYGHDVDRFPDFARRYRLELRQATAARALRHLVDVARRRRVELVTATRDLDHSGARVLAQSLSRRVR
jgi:uncharacterized protein YeaO (DUF488 family)